MATLWDFRPICDGGQRKGRQLFRVPKASDGVSSLDMSEYVHPSVAIEALQAEEMALARLAELLEAKGMPRPTFQTGRRLQLCRSGFCRPDGIDEQMGIVVEIYARQGRLYGSHRHKITNDILKLKVLKDRGWERCILLFTSDIAYSDFMAIWASQVCDEYEIEHYAVELEASLVAAIEEAQARQDLTRAAE